MRELLLISAYFPPFGGSGVFRMFRLCKYLPEFGWKPVVVSIKNLFGEAKDYQLLDELPKEVEIHPVNYLEPSIRGIKYFIKRHRNENSGLMDFPPLDLSVLPKKDALWKKPFKKVIFELFLPDLMVLWAIPALKKIRELEKNHKFQAVLSSSSPETPHLIGLWAKKRMNIPWLADFRDLWTQSKSHQEHSRITRWVDRRLEKLVLNTADHITTYSEELKFMIIGEDSSVKLQKFTTLSAAVDEDKFNQAPKAQSSYDLLYTGYISKVYEYPLWFFDKLDRINKKRSEEGKPIFRVAIAGNITPMVKSKLDNYIVKGWLDYLGYQSHQNTISLIKSAKALLLLHPPAPWWVPGKTAEYLYSGKPIVAVVGFGELSSILINQPGIYFIEEDANNLEVIMEEVLTKEAFQRVLPLKYTARGQAKIIAEILDNLVSQK